MKKIGFQLFLCFSLCCSNSFAQKKQSADRTNPVDFEKEVLPILEDNCIACHNSVVTKNKLDLEEIKGMIQGGKRGTALVPGKPEQSLLFLAASRKKKPHMPPLPNEVDAKALTPKELKILERWIREGAKESAAKPNASIAMSPLASRLNPIYALAVSPWGRLAAVGCGNRIHILDLLTREPAGSLIDPHLRNLSSNGNRQSSAGVAHLDFVHALAFHPDGDILASAGYRTVKLWGKSRPEFQQKLKGLGSLVTYRFDPKTNRIATFSKDGTIRILDVASTKELHRFRRQNISIRKICFLPDSKHLLFVTAKSDLEVVEISSGKTVSSHTISAEVRDAIVLEKGHVVLACADGVIRVCTMNDLLQTVSKKKSKQKKKPFFAKLKGHTKPVTALVALPNERFLSAGDDPTMRIWNSQKQLKSIAHRVPVVKIAVSSDGKLVATTSTDGAIRVWDLNTGKQVSTWQTSPGDTFRLAKATNDAEYARRKARLANSDLTKAKRNVTTREQEVKKAKEEKQKADKALVEAEKKFKTSDLNLKKTQNTSKNKPKDNKLKQQATKAKKAQTAAKAQRDRALKVVQNAKRSIVIAERGLKQTQDILKKTEAFKKQADEIQKKQSTEFEQTKKQIEAKKLAVENLAFASDNRTLLLVTKAGDILRFHATDGIPIDEISKPKSGDIRFVQRYRDEFVYGLSNAEIGILHVSPGWGLISQLGVLKPGSQDLSNSPFQNRVLALDFSADGKYLATAGGDPSREGELLLWDLDKKTVVRKFENAHSDTINAVKFSHDGKFLLTGSSDKFAKIFEVATGKFVRSFEGHAHHVMDVTWNADQSQIVTAGADNVIKVWNSRTGDQRRTIAGYGKQVSSVEFLGFGINILSCGGDATVRLHKSNNGQNYRRFNGGTNFMHVSRSVRTVKNALDKKEPAYILAGGETGILYLWNAKNAQLLKSFDFKKTAPRATASR